MKIGIAGAGGIGSNVAVNLIRSGYNNLKIVDFDTIELSNLNRQFYFHDQLGRPKVEALRENLLRINPGADIEIEVCKLDSASLLKTFDSCKLLVEGFDNSAEKKMLLETFCGDRRTVVSANGISGHDLKKITSKKFGNSYIVGDFVTDCSDAPLFAHKVSCVAAFMTEIIIELAQKGR